MTHALKAVDRMILQLAGDVWLDRLEKESNEPRNISLLREVITQHSDCMAVLIEHRRRGISPVQLGERLEPFFDDILKRYVALIKEKRERELQEYEIRRHETEEELKKPKRSKDKPA